MATPIFFPSPQCKDIIALLEQRKWTIIELIKTGVSTSPHRRFTEIGRCGFEIKQEPYITSTGKRVKRYWLDEK